MTTPLHLVLQSEHFKLTVLERLLNGGARVDASNPLGETPLLCLLKYCKINDLTMLQASKMLISFGASVNIVDNDGCTPLHWSYRNRNHHLPLVQELVNSGAEINAKDGKGDTPLHFAVSDLLCKVTVIQDLVTLGADVNASNDQNYTPLHLLFKKKPFQVIIFEELLRSGASVNAKNNFSETPMHCLLENPSLDVFPVLEGLISSGADVKAVNDKGITPLHSVCKRERFQSDEEISSQAFLTSFFDQFYAIKSLIMHGADVNAVDFCGRTSLHLLLQNKNVKLACLEELKTAGALLNVKDIFGNYPIDYLFKNLHNNCLPQILIALGVINELDCHANTSLHLVLQCIKFKVSILDKLFEAGVGINLANSLGETPLICLLRYCKVDDLTMLKAVRKLITLGACPNISDRKGCTPLHFSYRNHNYHLLLVKELLSAGAEINAKDKKGNTPLHYAVSVKKVKSTVIQELITLGSYVNAYNNQNYSPLCLLLKNKHFQLDVLEELLVSGAEVNARNNLKEPPLHCLLENPSANALPALQQLVSYGADVDAVNDKGFSVLHILFKKYKFYSAKYDNCGILDNNNAKVDFFTSSSLDQLSAVKSLILHGADVNAVDFRNRIPLHILLQNNNIDLACLEELVKAGSAINVKDTFDNYPVDYLFKNRNTNGLYPSKILAVLGADINFLDKNRNTPLHRVLKLKYFKLSILEELVAAGAQINVVNSLDETPLVCLLKYCKIDGLTMLQATEKLVALGADVNIADHKGSTPLHWSYRNRKYHLALVKKLLNAGADINAKDGDGYTALQYALYDNKKKLSIIQELITMGAEVNVKSYFGYSLLHEEVRKRNDLEVINLLLLNGAKVNTLDRFGKCPVYYKQNKDDIIKLFFKHALLHNSVNHKNRSYFIKFKDFKKAYSEQLKLMKSFHIEEGCSLLDLARNNGVFHKILKKGPLDSKPWLLDLSILNNRFPAYIDVIIHHFPKKCLVTNVEQMLSVNSSLQDKSMKKCFTNSVCFMKLCSLLSNKDLFNLLLAVDFVAGNKTIMCRKRVLPEELHSSKRIKL